MCSCGLAGRWERHVCVNEVCKALFVYVTVILATGLLVCVYCNNGVYAYMHSILGNGGNSLLGGIIEVSGRGDGQPALRQDTLCLLNIGSWTSTHKTIAKTLWLMGVYKPSLLFWHRYQGCKIYSTGYFLLACVKIIMSTVGYLTIILCSSQVHK